MRKIELFCWHDIVDEAYEASSVVVSDSRRKMARGFIKAFEQDKLLNPKEYELCCIGSLDENTGVITPYDKPIVINPAIVMRDVPHDNDEVVEE